jgi:ATP-dependent Clp protease adaptor protein ClpS
MSTLTKNKSFSKTEEKSKNPFKLVLHNDNMNSFEHVIKCLINVCKHEFTQAEQCAMIVHFKGECDIKWGAFEELTEMKEKLTNLSLSVTLEEG